MYDLLCMVVFHFERVRTLRNVNRQFAKRGF